MRRATIRTQLDDAAVLAASLEPDNTPEIETSVEDGQIVTHIERETTGGLQSTVDDYVVNLSVAVQAVQIANDYNDTNHE
ncbi:KEOPS complex subunit Pcc1 [Haladaptatus pallidirubidus]|uniref:KEOPS complex subunit Pcc1 n=1 Tax=Haladaptatus pallidirubidus TaxID=1008152 RepID=A0AAV3UCI9_9EURY|nr:KEOPS complex subunit Pcc1 [Haladaptatus pallidirubidus]